MFTLLNHIAILLTGSFVLYDGKTRRNVRVLAFSTARNLATLAEYNDWIADGTFYVAPRIFAQSYTIHAVIDRKCLPLFRSTSELFVSSR